jgi:hypothetical protein
MENSRESAKNNRKYEDKSTVVPVFNYAPCHEDLWKVEVQVYMLIGWDMLPYFPHLRTVHVKIFIWNRR